MRNYRIQNDNQGNFLSNFIRDSIYNSIKITQKFNSKDKISLIKSPMLILHAKNDEIVPYQMSVKLSELKPNADSFFSDTGNHSDTGWQDKTIIQFIQAN